MIRAVLVAAACLTAPMAACAQAVPEPDGYRMQDYRAPVPDALRGAQVIGAEAAHDLWQSGEAGFIDVMPRAPRPDTLPEGTIWHAAPRRSIPGALWLPNVGYGALAGETAAYFRQGLERATGGDRDHPVVIFCRAECWMSWNAAKRALAFGYGRVYWMPGGTDSWAESAFPTEAVTPVP
jgi:PQQ-dependent catabolism-associated CXXCW motif protein